MNDFFESAMNALLEAVEKNPDRPVEEIVKDCSAELGLDEKDLEVLFKSLGIIDKTTEKMQQLSEYQDAGGTVEGFLEDELNRVTENLPEKEADAVREAYRISTGIPANQQEEEEE